MEAEDKLSDNKKNKQCRILLLKRLVMVRKPGLIGAGRSSYDSFFKTCLTARLEKAQQDPKNPKSVPQSLRAFLLSIIISLPTKSLSILYYQILYSLTLLSPYGYSP